MELYFLSFVVILIAIVAMATGVIMKRKPIQGSCGGIRCEDCSSISKCIKKTRQA